MKARERSYQEAESKQENASINEVARGGREMEVSSGTSADRWGCRLLHLVHKGASMTPRK